MRYPKSDEISGAVAQVMRRIKTIESGLSGGKSSDATRQLAVLRHGLGSFPGAHPDAWGIAFAGCPEGLLGKGEIPSPAEHAVYLMLTLYAMHRQGQSSMMHDDAMPLGRSTRLLALESDSSGQDPTMPTTFAALVTSDSVDEMEHYLRQVITRLKASRLKIDYAKLTSQVMRFQDPYRRDGVRLEWSREYAYRPPAEQSDKEGSDD